MTLSLKPIGKPPGDATSGQMEAIADLGGPLQPWRDPRGPRAEPGVPACAPAGSAGALESSLMPSAWPRPTPASSRTSSPAPASTIAASPMRARSPSPWTSRSASRTTARRRPSGGCTSTSRAASTPAATIISGISASWASRRTAASSTRSRWAARRTRTPGWASFWGRPSPTRRWRKPIERIVERYLELRRGTKELFIDTVKRLGTAPFKEALYALH